MLKNVTPTNIYRSLRPRPITDQDGEDRELALAAHAFAVVEHVLHAEPVVDHDGRDKRNRGAHQKVEVEQLDERNEHAPVDAKGDKTHDSKLEELLGMRLCQRIAHVNTIQACDESSRGYFRAFTRET